MKPSQNAQNLMDYFLTAAAQDAVTVPSRRGRPAVEAPTLTGPKPPAEDDVDRKRRLLASCLER